jgi:hypothetical protein
MDAGEALVAPGPRVTKQMPGLPGQLAGGLRHHGRAAFLARQIVTSILASCSASSTAR